MDQNQFQQALQKYQKRKQKLQTVQTVQTQPPVEKPKLAPSAMPFLEVEPPKPKEPKPEGPKHVYKPMEVLITGPVDLSFKIDYSGTLMGGQLTKQSLEALFRKALSVAGRVV